MPPGLESLLYWAWAQNVQIQKKLQKVRMTECPMYKRPNIKYPFLKMTNLQNASV